MEKVLQLIQENARRTGNGSGISTIRLQRATGLTYKELYPLLLQLIDSGKIIAREGINHNLLFLL